MRGLIVFNESSGVSFYSVDEEFRLFLQLRLKETGAGPDVPPEDDDAEEDLREALALFFLPVLASFEVLASLKKPLLSITAEDDFKIVFNKHFNYVFVSVNGDDSETEEDMMRKLHVFARIICFLYGPVFNRMSPPNLLMRAIEWKRLNSLLKSYETLFSTEQSFLLEAVEHIRFGQLNTAQYACVSLAEDCLNSNLNGGIPNMKHALLIVGNKILASCGRSPQLPTADTLLLILLTTNLYCHDALSDLNVDDSKKSSDPSANNDYYPEDVDNNLQFSTPYQTPTGISPSDTVTTGGKTEEPSLHSSVQDNSDKDDHQNFKTPYSFDDEGDDMISKSVKGRLRNMLGFGKNRAGSDKLAGEYSLPADLFYKNREQPQARFHEQKVFLQLNPNHYIPHKIHCLEVYPKIVLVLISEPLSSNHLAGVICQTLANLRQTLSTTITKNSSVSGRSLYDIIEDSVKRIVDGSKSEAKSLNSESLKKCVVKVFQAFNRLKDANFLKYLEKNMTEQMELTHVVNNVENLIDSLIGLFEELYFSPKVSEYDKLSVVSRLQRLSVKLARDYGDYLCMKATINLPFPGFDSAYPGMIHFSFVDRSFDELTTPSIIEDISNAKYLENLIKRTGDRSASVLLKRKVWQMVKRSQRYLLHGYTSQTWMDDYFVYTYCLWVCMVNTNPGTSFKLTTPVSIKIHEDEPPGVLCGTFYKDMMGGIEGNTPGYINELYCIHEPNISIEVATAHCKSLAVQLWSNTKQALAPFPLIN